MVITTDALLNNYNQLLKLKHPLLIAQSLIPNPLLDGTHNHSDLLLVMGPLVMHGRVVSLDAIGMRNTLSVLPSLTRPPLG